MTHFRAIQIYLLLKQRADVERVSELAAIEEYLLGAMDAASIDFHSLKNWALAEAELTESEKHSVELSLRSVEITLKYSGSGQ